MNWYPEKKSTKRVLHCVAVCQDCDWSETDYRTAARAATVHVANSGHTVAVEHGTHYTVGPKLNEFRA